MMLRFRFGVLILLLHTGIVCSESSFYEYSNAAFKPYRTKRDAKELDDPDFSIPSDVDVQQEATTEHTYYSKTVITNKPEKMDQYYVDIAEWIKNGANGSESHQHLEASYRKAAGANIGFQFPFYGHKIENLTIATGGFCYVGDQTHSWLAATQYIAPLMANFDTMAENASIMYASNGSRMVIGWDLVRLRDNREAGYFNFQVSLFDNGDIWFVYKDIPINVTTISDTHHPCKLGISDAYLFTHQFGSNKMPASQQTKKVIHEYHRITIPPEVVKNNTIVILRALPTCLLYSTCDLCSHSTLKSFNCSWCAPKNSETAGFCSDYAGLHRKRQDWVKGDCAREKDEVYCPAATAKPMNNDISTTKEPEKVTAPEIDLDNSQKFVNPDEKARSGTTFLAIFLLLVVVGCGWLVYAFYNPHTTSGQLLIKYRPSKWQIPSSHVRYSASVHM